MPPKLTNAIIAAAIDGFEAQKVKLDGEIAALRALLFPGSNSEPAVTSAPTKRKRRKMSAAGRKAIAEAQRKRWAATKKTAGSSVPQKPKRKLSRAGRAAIVAATKKRWALKRAAEAAKAGTK